MEQSYNYNYYIILLVLFLTPTHFLIAQSTSLDFQSPNEVCYEQYFDIQNTSENYDAYQFDFCEGDLSLTPTLMTKEETAFNVPIGTSLIQSNGKWYGFVCSMNDNAIFRLDFGTSLTNKSPALIKLNNTGGLLNTPQDIKIIEYEGEFFAFIYNRTGNQLIRLNFGSSIENLNITSDALVAGNGFVNGGLDVIFDGKQWTASLTYSSQIRLINLGDSPKNIPGPSDIITTNSISDIDGIGDINFVEDNGQWYGFVVGFNSRTIHRLDFGDSLFVVPISHRLTSFELGSFQPRGLAIKEDNGEWFLFTVTQQGNFLRFNLGASINNANPVYTNLGNLGGLSNTYKVDIANSSSRWVALTTSWNTNKYHLIEFPQADCPFDLEYSDSKTVSLKALKKGTQYLTLYGKDSKGIRKQITNVITVTNNQAPKINFIIDNLCIDNPTTFTAQNLTSPQPLTSHIWDFGDGTTATGPEVTHQYAAPGTYKVRLSVEADGGCGNFIEKEVNIYEAPVPEFSFPAAVLCTNGAIAFENLTPGEYNEDITWLWDFGDGTTSTERSPSYVYTTGGTKTVTLTAAIPGCEASISHDIAITVGPSVNFSADNLCFGEMVRFTNLTTGDDITGYVWDFGNGESSTLENPTVTYDAAGVYEMSLTANNTSGCSNTFVKTVTIRDLPEVDFDNAMACSGSPTPFQYRSTVGDGNISSWFWDFGDGSTATEKNPTHVFSEAGTYEVKLITTSSYGCVDSTMQTVLVKAAPKADFTVEVGCPGTLSRFTDASIIPENDQIVGWVWVINSATFYSKNPEIPFSQSGAYEVKLTVNSSNGCSSTITKTIIIDPLPTPDFTVGNVCTGDKTVFTDISQGGGSDEIVDWQWQIGAITSNEQHPEVIFPQAENVSVRLTVTTARGCTASTQKVIKVNALPHAAFTVQKSFGAPPLQVNFKNNTSGTVSYQWLFGDPENSTSSEENPSFVYTALGRYEAKLVATNVAGCNDTASVFIETLIPALDVALEQLNTYTTKGDMQIVLKIVNKGSITIDNMDITLDLGGQLTLKEQFSGSILAGESLNYPLGINILEKDIAKVPYICASISINSVEFVEDDKENNSACREIAEEFVLLTPYPNPINDLFHINFVMPEKAPVRLMLMDMLGKKVMDMELQATKVGYNEYSLDFSSLTAGSYVMKISHQNNIYLRKVMVK